MERATESNYPAWGDAFLEVYRKSRDTRAALEVVNKTRYQLYRARKKSDEFRKLMDSVWQTRCEDLEDNAMSRATDGWEEPVYYQGEIVGFKRVYSTALTIFMLKANIPDTYHLERKEIDETVEERARQIRLFLAASSVDATRVSEN